MRVSTRWLRPVWLRVLESRRAVRVLMSKQIAAIYEGGVLRPLEPPELAEGEELDVVLLPRPKQAQADKFAAMQAAMNDELFLADLRETSDDFRHADAEETHATRHPPHASPVV
jgi:predicted DNA-binding antitoxin AbrB/MazE fold protein